MYRKQTVDVQGSDGVTSAMEILVFQPEGDGPFPGVMVAQHLPIAHEGLELDPFTIDVGDKLVAAGYACVIPYIFHWWTPETDIAIKREEFRDDNTLADLDAAYKVLCGLDNVDADRTAIMGHCWGGRVSWLGACHNPNYKAMATLYGGRIKIAFGDGTPPIELTENIPCPVIGVFGNDDQNPSPEDVADLDAALTAAGIEHEMNQYDGAGHGFQDFVNKDRWRPEQTADSWAKVIAFFDKHVK